MISQEEFKQKLESLKREQRVLYAWLCGVRVLPFLFTEKAIKYWVKNELLINLYSVLYALDTSACFDIRDTAAHAARTSHASRAARAAADAAARAAHTSRAANAARADAARAASAAYAAAYAAYAAHAAYDAVDAAAISLSGSSARKFESTLIQDINFIKTGKLEELNNDVGIYGKIWDNFQTGLREIGCGYWADIYAKLFKDRFKVDTDEIKLRLTVPESIRALGAADVAAYLIGLEKSKRLNEARIIILGEKGAGKTSLTTKLIDPNAELPDKYESTEGVEVHTWKLDENNSSNAVNIRIWDFAGHVVTHAVHRYFLAERCVYIIVYDGRTESRNETLKWLDHVKHYGGDSPVYIFVNVYDANPNLIDENYLYDNYKNINNIVYISLQDDIDSKVSFRNELGRLITDNPAWDTQVAETWFSLKERLESMFTDDKNELINDVQFRAIMQEIFEHSEYSNETYIENVKNALNSLGICLWYSQIANLQAYILNPNWITYGVYKIINWLGSKKTYQLYKTDLDIIFSEAVDAARYSERHEFLLELLIHYELAYVIYDNPVEGMEGGLVFPSLLSEKQPERNMEGAYPVKDSLLMRYRINKGIMPIDTITRFIVHHHKSIVSKNSSQVVWRRGVALNDKKGNEALVIEDGMEIRISVKGRNPLKFLDELRTTMNYIFQSYKSDNPELEYVVISNGETPIYVSDKALLAYYANQSMYIDPKTGYIIDPESNMAKYGINARVVNFNNIEMEIDMSKTHKESAKIKGNNNNLAYKTKGDVEQNQISISINDPDYADILETLRYFRKSNQAGEMKGKDLDILDEVIEEASKLDGKKGRAKISDLLSNAANAIIIATPIGMFLAENPDIPQKALEWFKTLPIPGIK